MTSTLKENEIYKQSYLTLCICLSLYFPLLALDKSNPKEVQFIFAHTKELDDVVELFWNKELSVEPIAYEDQRKILIRRIRETK
ncbi:hypothetical protein OAL67_00395 [bacterium]|nr:hypothetical protein [bacterium]